MAVVLNDDDDGNDDDDVDDDVGIALVYAYGPWGSDFTLAVCIRPLGVGIYFCCMHTTPGYRGLFLLYAYDPLV